MKTTTKLKAGAKVTLVSGAKEPRLVEYTVAKVTRTRVTLTAPGVLFPQVVCREFIESKLSK